MTKTTYANLAILAVLLTVLWLDHDDRAHYRQTCIDAKEAAMRANAMASHATERITRMEGWANAVGQVVMRHEQALGTNGVVR